MLQEGGDGVVEAQGHERRALAILHLLGGLLKARQHAALAAGEVFARVAVLANFREHAGHDLELVAHERVSGRKIGRAHIAAQVGLALLERKQVLQHGGLLVVLRLEQLADGVGLLQHAALDNLVGAG